MASWRALAVAGLSIVACGRTEEKAPAPPSSAPPSPASAPAVASATPAPPAFLPIGDAGELLYDGGGPAPDPVGIRACCEAVQEHARQAPPQHQATWNAAAKKCNEASAAGLGRAALGDVRNLLRSVGSPSVCQ